MVMGNEGSLLAELFSTAAMDHLFSVEEQVQQMLRFEWALSAALETTGLAPRNSAAPLAELLATTFLTEQRAETIRHGAALAGNIAIPFVKLLTQIVRERDADAARFIHTGATSQDVLDTALVLQMREAMTLLAMDLDAMIASCVALAREHAETIVAGRTWLQQGPPTTLGLQFAGYALALDRSRTRLRNVAARSAMLQFGGAVGTLASLGEQGLAVSAELASRLELREPAMPWHSHRDTLAEAAAALGLLTGTLGKMAKDISLSMQTEVGELFEPAGAGRGGSSTMPHKRNPVSCAAVLAAAVRVPPFVATMIAAMPQEHERGLGGWHAEWETLPQIFRLAAGALAQMQQTVEGLEVDAIRMEENLALTHGLVLAEAVSAALAEHVGRDAAHRSMEAASHRAICGKRHLFDELRADPDVSRYLSEEDLARLLDPGNYLGSARAFMERALVRLNETEV
jgi:3-carboxy-cis,cis-muconate cycloisomerase